MARKSRLEPTVPISVEPRRIRNHDELSFAEWLDRERIHPQVFASELGITVGYVYKLRSGVQTPGVKLRLIIEHRSGGAVQFDGWD